MRKLTYNLAPPLPSETADTNFNRMCRWERASGIKLSSLSRQEWLDVVETILCLTRQEAEQYLAYLQSQA